MKLYHFFLLNLFCLSVIAGPDNIAPLAKVTASSILSDDFKAENASDGIIHVPGRGEWACKGLADPYWGKISLPWIQLTWDEPQTINRIVLYDRASDKDHVTGGRLLFSDGSTLWVNQIANDGTGKAVNFPAKTVKWVKFVAHDGIGCDLGLSEIEVFPALSQCPDFISWVDPYIETTRGRYNYFITGARPFGLVGAAPLTRNKDQSGGGYNYNDQEILGFDQIHTWMISGLEIMPTPYSVNPLEGEQGWKSKFSHDEEIVQPGYQRVYLQDHKTWVEFTATDRVTFYRFRFTEDMKAQILINLGGFVGNSVMRNGTVKKANWSNGDLEGSFHSTDRLFGPKDVEVFFVAQFEKPCTDLEGWKGQERFRHISENAGEDVGVAAIYDVTAGEELKMKIAVSYTSIENARKNLEAECPGWDFDAVRAESRAVWNTVLGKIKVEGGDPEQRVKFYTDLWHVLLGRQKLNDVSGDYPDRTTGIRNGFITDAVFKIKTLPKDANGRLKYNMYSSDAFWLTQWNLNILWGLAWPEIMDEMSASLIQYAQNGYLLPRGPVGGGYSYIMTGCPATPLIVSTYMKGLLTKVDTDVAYQIVKQNHLPGGMLQGFRDILPGGAHTGNGDFGFYITNGYWPDSAGITVEATFQDFALAQMALSLGHTNDYDVFMRRSSGWKKLFDPEQKLLFPKNAAGEFLHTNPLSGVGWVEANSWQATWSVSHDIPGLAHLMGGNEVLCSMLNHAFEMARDSDFVYGYGDGYISYANQPGCSDAHVFNHAGKPWLTQYWARQVREHAYDGASPDLGYGGEDEDEGQMGGVSALMAIGLFSLQGNVTQYPMYDITSPIFDKITIELDPRYYPGKSFVIETENNSKTNMYIQQAFLNGKKLNTPWFSHKDFAAGGTLKLELGEKPNKKWGVSE